MSQHYIDEKRAGDKWSLPNVETFYHAYDGTKRTEWLDDDGEPYEAGWYYWYCLPGCMPDSDPIGPYATEADALKAAREDAGFCEHGVSDDEHCEVCDS